jgi:uncharacterized protein
MPVTVSYPGIYIEELPSSAHSIAAAPTSITAFVGYTHPFKTAQFGTAVELFSFADYEREFGGYFSSDYLRDDVANAVNEFFLNGGTDAYVVGLQPKFYDLATSPATEHDFQAATVTIGNVMFTAREPTDSDHPMTVTINNLQKSNDASPNLDVADITIAYGQVVETFRRVTVNKAPANPADVANYIETRIGTAGQPRSGLATVSQVGGSYGTAFSAVDRVPLAPTSAPAATWTTFNPTDFAPTFAQDSSLDKVDIFNLLVLPGVADMSVWSEAIAFCERKLAFLIMDPPPQAAADPSSAPLPLMHDVMVSSIPKSPNGAIYFPYLRSNDPLTNIPVELPPSGFVAGIYAREDTNRGVWKAPAGLETTIHDTNGLVQRGRMTDMRQGTLNLIGVNCLRDFPGIGTVVFGARTLVAQNPSFEQWKYVPVRRTALFLEQSLSRSLTWVTFEPNDEPLWIAIRTTIENFMLSLFHQGAFQGTTPSQAFQVKCDSSTTTQQDIDNGVVNIVVAFAPLKPAEFVIIKIAQKAGQSPA